MFYIHCLIILSEDMCLDSALDVQILLVDTI